MGLHIVLFQPEIPANTGNIGRTCAGMNATLHLVHPLGFSTDDKMVKRAGLDYWPHIDVREYDSIYGVYDAYPRGEFFYIENFGTKEFAEFEFNMPEKDVLFVFGKETKGIPRDLLIGKEDRVLRLPMTDKIRSYNLSNAAAIVLFEALRQQGFPGLIK